ncbi:hypothetical protein PIB30_043589 [Stylosanthes scabra]|uniref:Uncharacterized protein n=1 Tax=Stylosanthes scabra TaxID=79078 RepID=A0ABU6SFH0_9FABA|nr:hypothetical protein [Stylosanthes scabra]
MVRHTPRAPARWPWRARAVGLATFGRSYQVARRVSTAARWPWCVRALALGALGVAPGRATRPRPSDGAPAMDRKRKSVVAKGKGKLAMPPTRKSSRLAGLPPSLPPTSPKFVLGPNKLLVLSIAAAKVETRPKAQENIQAPVVKPPTNIKDLCETSPEAPKPKKVKVIDLTSDEEEEAQEKEAAMEQPTLVATQAEDEEKEEDPEEHPPSYSPLSPFPATPELGPREYDDPHNWNYDGDLYQCGTDVASGEPATAQDWDSAEEEEEDRSTSSTSTD